MPANHSLEYLHACLSLVSGTLGEQESVLAVVRGQTRYGRQTFVFFKVRIGTFENMTGNTPVNVRSVVVEVNVDPPHHARLVHDSDWVPLPE